MSDYFNWAFVKTEGDARKRFEEFESLDPLPSISDALLNAGDIYHYVRITSMVWPFDPNPEILKKKLKPASYEIDFLGEVYETDEAGVCKRISIEQGTPFRLEKNKIVFVFLKTKFFLPNYIAIRFNLRINLVHRGLLLGTGPLVDPGFAGQLLIPLHNLTSKDYTLIGGEGLIWVEFTKLSQSRHEREHSNAFDTNVVKFPESKRGLIAQYYFNEASNGVPAVSSIPGEIKETRKTADEAKRAAEQMKGWITTATIALAVSIAGLILTTWNLISNANNSVLDATNTVASVRADQVLLLDKVRTLEIELATRSVSEKALNSSTVTRANHDNLRVNGNIP